MCRAEEMNGSRGKYELRHGNGGIAKAKGLFEQLGDLQNFDTVPC